MIKNNLNLFIPLYLNIICLKNKKFTYIYIYNNNYFLKISTEFHKIYINGETNSIKLLQTTFNYHIQKNHMEIKFLKFLKSLNSHFFLKIKFKGKGYKINFYKKNKITKFFFGVSHIQIFVLKYIFLKKLSKYKFLLKSSNITNLNKLGNKMVNIRKINFYTLRGIRNTKSILIKRKGRKGV